jgi:hypothetical protein
MNSTNTVWVNNLAHHRCPHIKDEGLSGIGEAYPNLPTPRISGGSSNMRSLISMCHAESNRASCARHHADVTSVHRRQNTTRRKSEIALLARTLNYKNHF